MCQKKLVHPVYMWEMAHLSFSSRKNVYFIHSWTVQTKSLKNVDAKRCLITAVKWNICKLYQCNK